MTYFTDRVRSLIEQNEIILATDKLLTVLQNGREEILKRAVRISPAPSLQKKGNGRKSPRAVNSNPPLKLKDFLTQLEEKEPQMVEFLSHIELAEQKIEEGEWNDAKAYFQLAFEIHNDSFNLSKEAIISKINLCESTLEFNHLIEIGTKHFIEHAWRPAISTYTQAIELLGPDYDTSKVSEQITLCNKGIRFDEYLALAKVYKAEKNWNQAKEYFQKALELGIHKYYPEMLILNMEDEIRKCSEKELKRGQLPSSPQFNMDKIGTTLLLFLGILVFLALYLFYPELSTWVEREPIASPETQISEAAPFAAENNSASSPEMSQELVVRSDSAYLNALRGEESKSTDSLSTEKIEHTDSLNTQQDNFAIKEDPQLNLAPEINNAPTPHDIQKLLQPKSVKKEILEEEEFSYEAGRIAILPFCHTETDAGLAKRLYMDATFAIRNSGKAHQSAVSKNLVQGVIEKLGVAINDFCNETEAKEIAKSLRAESILLGTITHLPDNQIRINCEVLHVPSLRYSGEIVLTDDDMQRLRNNLKQEILQVFK